MKIDFAKKIIVALLAVLIILLVVILILMSRTDSTGEPDRDTESTVTTEAEGSSDAVTTVPDTEGKPATTPTTAEPPVTDPATTVAPETAPVTDPVTTVPPETEPVTTTPPETDPPLVGPEAPEGFSLTKKYETESGTKLNVRAVCNAVRNDNGSVSLTVEVYLIHYSLGMGARNGCQLTINENTVKFSTEKISQTENKKTTTLLFSHTETVPYGEIVDLYVKMPIRVTYGSGENAKYIEYLEIDTAFLVE